MAVATAAKSSLKTEYKKYLISAGFCAVVLGAIALDTTVVTIGSDQDFRQQDFSPDAYGTSQFPRIRDSVNKQAVDVVALFSKLKSDKKLATKEHATIAGAFPVFAVKFSGVAGKASSGVFQFTVEGLPAGVKIRVQSGPAINGTELRDIAGDIEFGEFKNQIEFQNVGAGINRAMSAQILKDLDRAALTGKTISVVGAFKLINPKNWLVTPVEFKVK